MSNRKDAEARAKATKCKKCDGTGKVLGAFRIRICEACDGTGKKR